MNTSGLRREIENLINQAGNAYDAGSRGLLYRQLLGEAEAAARLLGEEGQQTLLAAKRAYGPRGGF